MTVITDGEVDDVATGGNQTASSGPVVGRIVNLFTGAFSPAGNFNRAMRMTP